MGTSVADPVVADPVVDPAPPAAPAAPVVPEKYDLQVPDGSTVDPALIERTAATARELGLTNEAAQKLFDTEVKDATDRATAHAAALTKASEDAQKALIDAWQPNGVEWKKQQKEWTDAAKADPTIGGEKFAQSVESAGQAVERFGDPEFKKILEETGYGRHPVVLRFLAKIGNASRESTFANNGAPTGGQEKSLVNKFYGKTTPETV